METVTFNEDIPVFYIQATSYPEGILEAHQKLHKLIPFSIERKYFGVSRPEGGPIIYRAAAEEKYKGEGKKLTCETLILKKGDYIGLTIKDYLKDPQIIYRTFQDIIHRPDIDPQGYCVEWYISDKDVMCLVRKKD